MGDLDLVGLKEHARRSREALHELQATDGPKETPHLVSPFWVRRRAVRGRMGRPQALRRASE